MDATLRLFGHHLVITGHQRFHSRTGLRIEKEENEHGSKYPSASLNDMHMILSLPSHPSAPLRRLGRLEGDQS